MLVELRKDVLAKAKKLREYGLVVIAGGTVCARDPETGYIAITASGMDYDEMTWEDICVIDDQMNVIDGKRRISVASDMFIEIMKARKDINAVIHTHSRYATSFACVGRDIPVATTTQANLCGSSVPVVKPLHPGPHNSAYLQRIVDAFGGETGGYACNLQNHGPVCGGKNLAECIEIAVTVEVTAQNYVIAQSLGTPYILNEAETKIAYDFCHSAVGQG